MNPPVLSTTIRVPTASGLSLNSTCSLYLPGFVGVVGGVKGSESFGAHQAASQWSRRQWVGERELALAVDSKS